MATKFSQKSNVHANAMLEGERNKCKIIKRLLCLSTCLPLHSISASTQPLHTSARNNKDHAPKPSICEQASESHTPGQHAPNPNLTKTLCAIRTKAISRERSFSFISYLFLFVYLISHVLITFYFISVHFIALVSISFHFISFDFISTRFNLINSCRFISFRFLFLRITELISSLHVNSLGSALYHIMSHRIIPLFTMPV